MAKEDPVWTFALLLMVKIFPLNVKQRMRVLKDCNHLAIMSFQNETTGKERGSGSCGDRQIRVSSFCMTEHTISWLFLRQ